jgi:hypothetical protein
VPEHAYDPQADAFRGADETDWVTDDLLMAMVARGELVVTTHEDSIPVEVYESGNWDAGRHPDGPKTVAEAKAVLRERVQDPRSPDWDTTVYDDLEQG